MLSPLVTLAVEKHLIFSAGEAKINGAHLRRANKRSSKIKNSLRGLNWFKKGRRENSHLK